MMGVSENGVHVNQIKLEQEMQKQERLQKINEEALYVAKKKIPEG